MTARPVMSEAMVAGVIAGDRAVLARAITLVESRRREHRKEAAALIEAILPRTGGAHRVGLTGLPGAGKSTAIDALGSMLTAQGRRVAVLAVDPSSTRTGGSILGDKTRMARLAVDERAFIRPSPSAGTLGGIAARTREAMLLCEAAGYDVVMVETVGVGQSETAVADIVDVFVALMLPGAGDELQGIKKGLLEFADIVAVNKADGEGREAAQAAAAEYQAALHVFLPSDAAWRPPVVTCSARTGEGLDELWAQVERHRSEHQASGAFERRRRSQQVRWMWTIIDQRLRAIVRESSRASEQLPAIERAVQEGTRSPEAAADEILSLVGLDAPEL